MDFFNVLNHPGNPNSVGGNGMLTTQSSGREPAGYAIDPAAELVSRINFSLKGWLGALLRATAASRLLGDQVIALAGADRYN